MFSFKTKIFECIGFMIQKQILSISGKPDSPICCVVPKAPVCKKGLTPQAVQMNESNL